jgi:hypothetical protein
VPDYPVESVKEIQISSPLGLSGKVSDYPVIAVAEHNG